MAVTTPANVDTSIPEVWAKDALRRFKVSGFWGNFVGSAIKQRAELLNRPGDLIHIQVTNPLAGAGVSGDTAALTGNEEALTTSEMKVATTLYRHAVRLNRRAVKKSILDLRAEANMRLEEWGMEKMDALRFAGFFSDVDVPSGSLTPNVYGPNSHLTPGTIVAGDVLTVRVLQEIKLKLSLQLAKPLMDDSGLPVYGLVTHPNATFQLKQEARYESWVREAAVRGERNPFFRGAIAVVDGMVIYEHPRVSRTNTGAGSIPIATGVAFGKEAFIEGLDENVHSEEAEFDYGLEYGKSLEFAVGQRRGLEDNSIRVLLSAPAV